MFYALLILPHIAAIGGLIMFALRTGSDEPPASADGGGGWRPDDDRPTPPTPPAPRAGPTGPPLTDADQPRRLRVGEQLSERAVRRPRREHPTPRPTPTREVTPSDS